jgi:hypothetical protein
MAKIRQARRCRARSSRTGAPCRAWAVTGGTVCRAHGGGSPAVRAAAAQRREIELVEKAMLRAERQREDWILERLAQELGTSPSALTVDDVRRYMAQGRPAWLDECPPLRLDLRIGPRRPVVIRRR